MDHSQMTHIATEDGMVMVMAGIPSWLFILSAGMIVLLSFVVTEWRGVAVGEGFRLVLTPPRLHKLVRMRGFQFAFQAPILALFLFTIYCGLFGSYARNIAPVLTWTVWWAGLIFSVALVGNIWCFVCPWDALANVASRLSFWKKKTSLSLGLKLPGWLNNIYPALILFVLVTWAELGWNITNNPRQTAILGILMAVAAMAFALVFEKKAFCSSMCLVGRTCGLYSTFAPVEIRARDERVCGVCKDPVCLSGNDAGFPCPTGINMSTLNENTMCTSCTECFKSCPSLVPTVRARPFARDISRVQNPRRDEAWFALVLLALTGFHGLSMTPVWQNFAPGTRDIVGRLQQMLDVHELVAFSLGMAMVMALPLAGHALCTGVAMLWVRGTGVGYWRLFVSYAYAVLPVALFYHLAHNAMHLFMEGGDLIPLLSDPLGTGADWFGTAGMHPGSLLSQTAIWWMQVTLIVVGHVFGVTVAYRISRRLFDDHKAARRSLIPMLAMMILLSVGGLWLMSLDMNMRMGRM